MKYKKVTITINPLVFYVPDPDGTLDEGLAMQKCLSALDDDMDFYGEDLSSLSMNVKMQRAKKSDVTDMLNHLGIDPKDDIYDENDRVLTDVVKTGGCG